MASKIDTRIRPEVRNLLGRLKNGIRWYVFAEGITLLIVLAAVLFWVSFSVDGLWFTATKYELAKWFRVGFSTLAIAAIAIAGIYWIGLRLFRSVRNKALALVLERRFPDLNDRLVTSVEVAESISGQESDLTVAMLNRTIESASEEASRLNVSDVFETKPVRWASIGAIAAIISVVGYGVAFPGDFQRWADAWVNYEEVYWDRDTKLEVHVIDVATNTRRAFDGNQRYRHPRGGQLTLLISVPETDETGKQLVVPAMIDVITIDEESGESQTTTVPRIGGSRTYKYERAQMRESMSFYVVGNDYKNRKPYFVEVVDPPRIDVVKLNCDYPPYTKMQLLESRRELTVEGRQIAVPIETRFELNVTTNKPLLSVQMQYGRYDLAFGWFHGGNAADIIPSADPKQHRTFKAELNSKGLALSEDQTLQAAVGTACSLPVTKRVFRFPIPEQIARRFFLDPKTDKHVGFRLPFSLTEQKTAASRTRSSDDRAFPDLGTPFLMPPDTEIRLYLEDVDEIRSPEASELTINAIRDLPPEIEAKRVDIGTAVTRFASIPITGLIKDDYGIASARLEYRTAPGGRTTTEGQPWQPKELHNPPQKHAKSGLLPRLFEFKSRHRDEDRKYEVFEVSEIKILDETAKGKDAGRLRDLKSGDLLTISVYATDADNLNGPNVRRGAQLFDFNIVTVNELHGILYEKEGQLRIRFEDIIREVEESQKELDHSRVLIHDWKQLQAAKPAAGMEKAHKAKLESLWNDIRYIARNSRSKLTKNHNETREIENGFRQIRAELINNKLLTESDTKRLDQFIIKELNNANKDKVGNYDLVDAELFKYNRDVDSMDKDTDPIAALDESIGQINSLLTRLRNALKEMQELVKFHEMVRKLGKIISDEEALIRISRILNARSLFGPGKNPFDPKKKP